MHTVTVEEIKLTEIPEIPIKPGYKLNILLASSTKDRKKLWWDIRFNCYIFHKEDEGLVGTKDIEEAVKLYNAG